MVPLMPHLTHEMLQVVLPEENKPSDPPPLYTSGAPPSYTLDKEVMTDPLPIPPLETLPEISFFSSNNPT